MYLTNQHCDTTVTLRQHEKASLTVCVCVCACMRVCSFIAGLTQNEPKHNITCSYLETV